MPEVIKVDFDKKRRLAITVPYRLSSIARGIPARWSKTLQVWIAPLLRGSIRALDGAAKMPGVEVQYSPAVKAAIEEYESRLAVKDEKFPLGYRFKMEPRPYQRDALNFVWPRTAVALGLEMGCLDGGTMLRVSMAKKSREMTIKEFYEFSQRNPRTELRARCLMGGMFGMNLVEKVWSTGTKECVEVVLDDGKRLVCTPDHKVLTAASEWVEAQHLVPGAVVQTNGTYVEKDTEFRVYSWEKGFIDKNGYRRVFVPRHPRSNRAGAVYEHILVMELVLGRWVRSGEHIHHLDGDKANNSPDNLKLYSQEAHLKLHGPDYRKNLDGGVSPVSGGRVVVIPKLAAVVSVAPAGARETFDLTMQEPHQNYVANGVVVHNTGKTKVTIDTAAARFLGGQIQQMLVMCPASITSTWAEEIVKHCPIKAKIYFELPKEPDPEVFQILVVSTEGLGISLKAFERAADFVRRGPTLSIVDESSWIKEQKAVRSQRAHMIGGASAYRMILNGTLVNNSPLDLWSQFQFLDPNILGQEWYDFRAQHAIFGGFQGRQILATMRMDEVVRDVAPWTLIIKKSDVLKDLPPKIYERREVQPTPEQKALIKEIKKKPLHVALPPEIAVGNVQARMVLERVLRQRQIAAGFVSYLTDEDMAAGVREPRIARLKKSPKTEETMAVLEQTDGKVVIWCTFTEEVEALRDTIAEVYGPQSVVTFYGKMTKEEQDEARHRLQGDPTCRFFVGNMAVGAIGITLTAASTEIYHSNSFSYLQRAQSEDRLHRLGQPNAVTIIDIVMKGTADELCFDAVMEKRDVAEFITGAIHESRLKQLEVE